MEEQAFVLPNHVIRVASSLLRARHGMVAPMIKATIIAAVVSVLLGSLPANARTTRPEDFSTLAEEFVYTTLSFSPASATGAGLHTWTDPKTGKIFNFDEMLDDYSPAEIARQRAWYTGFRKRLLRIRRASLDAQTRVDYDLLMNAVGFALYSFDDERFYERKPQNYAENLGGALFAPMSLEYAPKKERARHFVARLEKTPAFLDQAMANLKASNPIYRKVALEATEGVVSLVEDLGKDFVKDTDSGKEYEAARRPALDALERYAAFIRDELPKRANFDWRMGQRRFAAKWKYYLQVSFTPAQMLVFAERELRETRAEMLRLSEPLAKQWFPEKTYDRSNPDAYLNAVVKDVLSKIQEEKIDRDDLVERTRKDVEKINDFIRSKGVVSIVEYPNLKVIPTPEFMRGSYGIAGAVFAPALEPNLSTFYWVTPIPKDWTDDQANGRLREYNKYKLLTLHAHEAIPGHVVQGIYANLITPEWRRILRAVYGNVPYIEGWAVYAEHVMEEVGLDGGDPTKMRLISLKANLRVLTNAIIDIRMHTKGMTDEQCVNLMIDKGFQERPEAVGKLQRCQLDYVQLNTYYAGLREWRTLRADAEKKGGKDFSMKAFHDRVLLYGPIPVPSVRRLYMAGAEPTAKMVP